MTARISVRRLPPPGLGGGINAATYLHSSSVRSLGYLRRSRLYFGRFSSVHIGDPSANQVTSLASQPIHAIQEVSKRTLRVFLTRSRDPGVPANADSQHPTCTMRRIFTAAARPPRCREPSR